MDLEEVKNVKIPTRDNNKNS